MTIIGPNYFVEWDFYLALCARGKLYEPKKKKPREKRNGEEISETTLINVLC